MGGGIRELEGFDRAIWSRSCWSDQSGLKYMLIAQKPYASADAVRGACNGAGCGARVSIR